MIILETQRLFLRTWQDEDIAAYFAIDQDPMVIEYLPGPLSIEQVENFTAKANQHAVQHGFTFWAVELKQTNELMGFTGLNVVDWPAHFTPAVEIGWRLGSQFWNQGYATEAALASLSFGFHECAIPEIVSFTVPANVRSIRVMEKIGLVHDELGGFQHPKLPPVHPLAQHVLYRLTADQFQNGC